MSDEMRARLIEAAFQAMKNATVGDDELVGYALARSAFDALLSELKNPSSEMIEAGALGIDAMPPELHDYSSCAEAALAAMLKTLEA